MIDDVDRSSRTASDWVDEAVRRVEADANRSADTHLVRLPLPALPGVDVYLKDESTHPTGSLKHRLARSLFLYALCNGQIAEGTTVIEASSGSTAVSEAYFARMLGLPFVAVMPRSTSAEKIALIEREGGRCHLVDDPTSVYAEATRLAEQTGGHYLDQFTYAERATDWRGNNNIAESIFEQMRLERFPEPSWVVVGAGTGGTSATIGRYARYRRFQTRLAVVDPEGSAFFGSFADGDPERTAAGSSIRQLSVISRCSREASSPDLDSASATTERISASRRSRAERFTETPICSGHAMHSRQASKSTKRVMSEMMPISSASLMKTSGGMAPFSGCTQRASASAHSIREPSALNIGWKTR